MRSTEVVSLVFVVLANVPLLAQPMNSPSAPPNWATNRPAYVTRIEHVAGPGLLPANFAYVTFGTNKFGFVVPEGFHLDTKDGQKVTLVSTDLNYLLTFRMLESVPAGDVEPDPAYYRQLLLDSHPGVKVLEEFTLTAVSRQGPAFDLFWKAAGTVLRQKRVAFIPCAAGVLEFSLVSSPEKFEAAKGPLLNTFLLTFRVPEADGRIRMPVLSDRF
jgi:hypothetical protein